MRRRGTRQQTLPAARLDRVERQTRRVTAAGGVGPSTDLAAIHDNISAEISAVAAKTTPVAADLVLIEDSADSNSKKKLTLSNLMGLKFLSGGALPAAPSEQAFFLLTTVPNKLYVSMEGTAGWNWYPMQSAV